MKTNFSKFYSLFSAIPVVLILFILTSTAISQKKNNNIPDGLTKEQILEFRDENGKKMFSPGDSLGDALQRNIFYESEPNSSYGWSVSSAGNVNGDQYDDIIVGAYSYNSVKGRAYIYYGDGNSNMNTDADVVLTGGAINDKFGYSVSSAGDVNGDGFSDVVVSASGYSSNTGRAYVFFGGNPMDSLADVIMTGSAGSRFGESVSCAGNVNGDEYSDVIVGAPGYSSNTGRAYVFFGGVPMDTTADVTMTGGGTNYYFGESVSSAGNVNGDVYSDVVVGAYGYNSNTGRAYVFYGGAAMNNVADVTMTGGGTNNYFGYSVSSAGDVNGDEFSDVVVGAYGSGRAYVFLGGDHMNNIADIIMTGEAGSYFGYSVSSAGDVNGDVYSDVVVGAFAYSSNKGMAYVFFGGAVMNNTSDITMTGENANDKFGASVSSAGDVNGDGYSDIIAGAYGFNSSTGRVYLYDYVMRNEIIPDYTMTGGSADNNFGNSVSSAGDVNGDSIPDVIVGAPGYSSNRGRAYVFFGGPDMDNLADVMMTGEAASIKFGNSVSSAGDVNKDGYSDVIVGAYAYGVFINTGRAYVFYGGPDMDNLADVTMTGAAGTQFGVSVSSSGDVNRDGYSDVVVGANAYNSFTGRAYVFYGGPDMDSLADVTMTGENTLNSFGFSVSTAGDVNHDGYPDVVVGAHGYSSNTGRAYVFYGGHAMDGTEDITMTGENTGDYFGYFVSSAGDVNGERYSDVVVGAPGWKGLLNTGRAYIFYGGDDNLPDVIMTGEATTDNFGKSVSSAGDVNGDGYSDVVVGATGQISNTGRAYIFFGDATMDTTADVNMTGEETNNNFGYSVSSAGDVNGDGYSDVVVGATGYSFNTGRAYIFTGSAISINPILIYVKDVPNDKGGKVILKWARSGYDTPGDKVTYYVVQRSNPPIHGNYFWENIDDTIAENKPFYIDTVDTPNDSVTFCYRIIAKTHIPTQFWISNILCGRSIDNTITLNLTVFIEGFYNAETNLQVSDTIGVYLSYNRPPFNIVDSSKAVVASNGSAILKFGNAPSGTYFIVVRHRNSIETWSANSVLLIIGNTVNYDFSISSSQAYGNNMIQVDASPLRFAIYSGDVNQDGVVEITDVTLIENDAFNFVSGYVATDVNGDGAVDIADQTIADNNGYNFVGVIKP